MFCCHNRRSGVAHLRESPRGGQALLAMLKRLPVAVRVPFSSLQRLEVVGPSQHS